ncbi:LysE family translocator [Thalassovita mediterranea]|jgi:threonine/homoserine/homoserine lactone efflux protein|uniref:Cysteine/O-acetylserine efflux protein n=1 Tax=Thalassovita mediterranea TaxID=340021 RepID=A0A0P1GMR1_9RHOB|nr:LysE family translocator [Thalassovita mediterranea]CUH83529.1 Cysteine/O-acetylserine efflux protein [Thalassovita mediterranea]SIS34466.1 Threonine/homoserine/homoserine lactone efflux protein [Thalassovita mediterranea]
MTYDLIPALAAFAFVTSVTPGPNNLMLMTSGANYGFRRSIPHMLGIAVGFTVMVALVGVGLMGLFDAVPVTYTVLKVAGIAYLLWLAWKIANAGMPDTSGRTGKPMTFLQAAAFQWVNPKAWQMALTAITLYAPDRSMWSVLVVAMIFGAINLPTVSSWTILGQQMSRVLSSPLRLRVFNVTMAALLVASLLPVL